QPPSPIRVTIDPTTGQPLLLTPQSTDQRDDCDASMLQWQETPLPPAWRTFIHHTAQQLLHEQHAELEMMRALRQLAEKYELPRETVLSAVEEALTEAYRREFAPPGIITVRIDPITGKQQLYTVKTAVRRVHDPHREIALSEAQHLQPNAVEHEAIFIETDLPESWGRVAAMAFRHLVQQKMHSAKQRYAFERFSEQEGELVSGFITRIDPASGSVFVDIGGSEAELPKEEQVPTETYTSGQHLRAYLLYVRREEHSGSMATRLRLSRTTRSLLRRLLELEVPEIHTGAVEIKGIAREPGSRSKVAVWAHQEGLDPVGACVGIRSVRIQNLVKELHGEKVDIILWDPDPGMFVAHALSPATTLSTEVREHEKKVIVEVPADQLSLAIGKEGQNARLASRLTHWNIDIHPADSHSSKKTASKHQSQLSEEAIDASTS
ncbi:MAG: transcription termination factor NusA, partial [Chloroflexi bacterium]|nr:transcription termination factor NusA [Chloroflexota bacterium]